MGVESEIISPEPADALAGDSKHFYEICVESDLTISHGRTAGDVDLSGFALLVDGLLGTGISGEVRPESAAWIEGMNGAEGKRLSIDIPSGVNATDGTVCGSAVQADATVTMGFLKQGLVLQPGRSAAGDVTVADLGYPEEAFANFTISKRLTDEDFIASSLTSPKPDTYKHRQGKLLVIAGSRGFTGAAVLAAGGPGEGGGA
jgi:NAD(P)H-hydrate epimerase